MNKLTAFPVSAAVVLPFLLVAQIGSSQITTPAMEVVKAEDIEAREMQDGRVTQRVSAATVGLIKVEWPAGTSTTAHNHANELVLHVLEGRLRAFSGDQEFVVEAGDVIVIPAWVDHRYEALEDSLTVEASGPP